MIGASKATSTRAYQLISTTNITSTGVQSYTIPAGVVYIELEMYGAGGAGGHRGSQGSGRGAAMYPGGGGGGGAYLKKTYYGAADMQVSDTLNFTVGVGGAVTSGNGTEAGRGGAGGNTTLDTHIRDVGGGFTQQITNFSSVSAGGGGGGAGGPTSGDGTGNAAGGAAGSATNGDTNTNGDVGGDANNSLNNGTGGVGGDAATYDAASGEEGGGGNPGNGSGFASSRDGVAGTAPGGGGGGAGGANAGDGAVGGAGKVIVRVYG